MPFFTYLLHCRGGKYYAGHTEDIDRRVAEHESGAVPGFTSNLLPVKLVWMESFQTRDDAKAMEHRIKGWSRSKKRALIRGDWDEIGRLAKKKDGPSTSSGQAGVRGTAALSSGQAGVRGTAALSSGQAGLGGQMECKK